MKQAIACLLLLSLSAAAQETPQPAEKPRPALETAAERAQDAPTPHEVLASALMKYQKRRDLVVNAGVKQKQKEEDVQGGGGIGGAGIQIFVQRINGNQQGEPFEGRVEGWRDSDGNAVLVSNKELPGFELYITPDRSIQRITTEDKTPALDQLRTELLSLMDGDRFSKTLMAAKLEHKLDEATGEHIWTGPVAKDIVRPVRMKGIDPRFAQVMGRMQARVLRAQLELRISKDAKLTKAKVTIVRNDPMREMVAGRQIGNRIIIRGLPGAPGAPGQPGGRGGAGGVAPAGKDDEKHDIEGISTVYTLDFTKKQPSERALAFKREIARTLGE